MEKIIVPKPRSPFVPTAAAPYCASAISSAISPATPPAPDAKAEARKEMAAASLLESQLTQTLEEGERKYYDWAAQMEAKIKAAKARAYAARLASY